MTSLIPIFTQPHEDGPSYHPVVATMSLGSHTVFHYYRYKDTHTDVADPSEGDTPAENTGSRGKAIDKTPVMSLLLEPRSLVITTQDFYTSHLHGIDDVETDMFSVPSGDHTTSTAGTVANIDLISDPSLKAVAKSGGELARHARYSLTCRDVQRVVSGGVAFGRR